MNAESEENEFVPDDRQPDRLVIGHVESSPTIGKIAGALAKAQGGFGIVGKDSKADVKNKDGKFLYAYTYGTLADSIAAVAKALSENGIALLQPTATNRGAVTVTTILAHSSGEWMSSSLSMPVTETKAQAVGSAITYARRYALQAFIGIAPEDDDGSHAQQNPPSSQSTEPRASTRKVTPRKKAPPRASKPDPEPQHQPSDGEESGTAERLKQALADYMETSDDKRSKTRIMADALGKPWPNKPTEMDRTVALTGLTGMTQRAGGSSDEPEEYEAGDGREPLDTNEDNPQGHPGEG